MMGENNDTLRDIKPLLEIPDNSFYIYWGLILFGAALALMILFFVGRKLWLNRRKNLAKEYLAALKAIDWGNSKEGAYRATHYARLLATDARRKELFDQLVPLLEKYKYKREVDPVDEETLRYYNLFVQVADESV